MNEYGAGPHDSLAQFSPTREAGKPQRRRANCVPVAEERERVALEMWRIIELRDGFPKGAIPDFAYKYADRILASIRSPRVTAEEVERILTQSFMEWDDEQSAETIVANAMNRIRPLLEGSK